MQVPTKDLGLTVMENEDRKRHADPLMSPHCKVELQELRTLILNFNLTCSCRFCLSSLEDKTIFSLLV